jgi:hypothetical protein
VLPADEDGSRPDLKSFRHRREKEGPCLGLPLESIGPTHPAGVRRQQFYQVGFSLLLALLRVPITLFIIEVKNDRRCLVSQGLWRYGRKNVGGQAVTKPTEALTSLAGRAACGRLNRRHSRENRGDTGDHRVQLLPNRRVRATLHARSEKRTPRLAKITCPS